MNVGRRIRLDRSREPKSIGRSKGALHLTVVGELVEHRRGSTAIDDGLEHPAGESSESSSIDPQGIVRAVVDSAGHAMHERGERYPADGVMVEPLERRECDLDVKPALNVVIREPVRGRRLSLFFPAIHRP